jgi:hypothetical protein
MRKVMVRDLAKVEQLLALTMAACNLTRLRIGSAVGVERVKTKEVAKKWALPCPMLHGIDRQYRNWALPERDIKSQVPVRV